MRYAKPCGAIPTGNPPFAPIGTDRWPDRCYTHFVTAALGQSDPGEELSAGHAGLARCPTEDERPWYAHAG